MIFNCNDHTKGNWLHTLRADSDVGEDWGQEEEGTTEVEIVG